MIKPRKISVWTADIICDECGKKATYYSYETNKKRMMEHLPKYWNAWQLFPAVKCWVCQKKNLSMETIIYKQSQYIP